MQHEITVTSTLNEKYATAPLVVEFWTRKRAFRLGMKWCLAAWAGAVITLPLPGIHFVAVPACLLAGPPLWFVIYRFYRGSVEILSGKMECPGCHHTWELTKQTVDFPCMMTCPACSGEVFVSLPKH